MRDPAEIEAEIQQKKQEKEKKSRERIALHKQCWDDFGQHFQFKDIVWLSKIFWDQATLSKDQKENGMKFSDLIEADGHPCQRIVTSKEGAYRIVKDWLGKRYGKDGLTREVKEGEPVGMAVEICKVDVDQKEWTFQDVVSFTSAYSNVYVDIDDNAGFGKADCSAFQEKFDIHRGSSPGLKPEKLWDLLKECQLEYKTVEDQKKVLAILDEVDKNKNGILDPDELLHLLRKLIDSTKAEPREREHKLLRDSGMTLQECEDWFELYTAACEGRADGKTEDYISLGDVKSVFDPLELAWDRDSGAKLKEWLAEVDDDFNGKIDFGEFCCLVHKMWEANFGGLQSKIGKE